MPRFPSASRLPGAIVATVLLAGCNGDRSQPVAPQPPRMSTHARATSSSSTNPHVFFLPPLASQASYAGTFDATQPVQVIVYAGAGAPCADGVTAPGCPSAVAHFSVSDGTLAVDAVDEYYMAVWHRDATSRDAGTYRIVVRVGSQVLDFLDVDALRGGAVPIKIRVEQGALSYSRTPVGPQGGTIQTANGAMTLAIPAGAVTTETDITAQPAPVTPADGFAVGGTIYEFGPDGTQFATPVSLSFTYDPAVVKAGVSQQQLRVFVNANGKWTPVAGSSVDVATHTVTASVSHFTSYAVLPAGYVAISSGENHACGLTGTGDAWCWGANGTNQLGAATTTTCTDGTTTTPCSPTPVEVQGGLVFASIEAGTGHTCGVTTAGQAYCWGANQYGQLGNGTTTNSAVPVLVSGGLSFSSIAAEYAQTCGLTTAGAVYCWGGNRNGQLGVATTGTCTSGAVSCATTPQAVPVPAASMVDVGLAHACALTTAGDVYCWGWNAFGQIGTGGTGPIVGPTRVSGGPYSFVSAGAVHTCAIGTAGAGYCWGTNFSTGALGDGSNLAHYAPVLIAGGYAWSQMDATNGNYIYTHTCGVTTANVGYCWGANDHGQLGVTTAPSTCTFTYGSPPTAHNFDCALTPNAVSGGLSFTRVTAGRAFTCGYTTTGAVYCWGWNLFGQLGNGTTTDSRVPVMITVGP